MRFTRRWSTSTSAKSVLMLRAALRLGVMLYPTSRPTSPGKEVGSSSAKVVRQFWTAYGVTSRPSPCETPWIPVSSPAWAGSVRDWFRRPPLHRISSFRRRIVRWKLRPQVSFRGLKFSVLNGMRISADHPSSRRAVRASQMPSQLLLTPKKPLPPRRPSPIRPAGLISKN